LSGRLLQLQDEERRRLARELHDTSAQHIAGLVLSLTVLQKLLPHDNTRADKLCQDSLSLAETAAQEIRTMSYLLHPPSLESVGLAGAIREYAAGFAQRSGIPVEVEAPAESFRLSRAAELALFRICQEGLANIHRHSGSARAKIRLAAQPAWITLEVEDAGHGIPGEKLALITEMKAALGVGIAGMRERMRELGGQLEIHSGKGGTIVRATLPFNHVTNDP
jgi:signal transduction histidine kinase